MNKRVVRRLLETFFRRWWLYVLPVALFTAAGVAFSLSSGSGYQSAGVIDVSKGTLLSELTSIRGETFGFDTPAISTARTVNSLLRTDNFIEAIAKGAGVTGALTRGELTALDIRQSIAVTPDGDNLLSIVATTDNPDLSARLAQATIDSFMAYQVAGDVSESRAAEQFFENQLAAYKGELDAAQAALTEYAATHPGGPQAERPLDEQVEIERLKSVATQAQVTYAAAQGKSDEARLATEQATTDVGQRLRLIDTPVVPTAPQPRLMKSVVTAALFTIVGLLISFGAVVLGTTIDRTMRTADDVEVLLGLPVLTVVPETRSTRRTRRSAKKPGADLAIPTRRTPTKTAATKPADERPRAIKAGTATTSGRSGTKRVEGQRETGATDRTSRQDPANRGSRGGPGQ
jgi:uncharacterized protein involved in exopolysaccharide biosynthesis